MQGIDYITASVDDTMGQGIRLTCLKRTQLIFQKLENALPLYSQVKHIQGTQAIEIQSFFRIFRRIFINSLVLMILFIPMTVIHILYYLKQNNYTETYCQGALGIQIPCLLYYSRMDESNLWITYPVSLLVFCQFRLFVAVNNLKNEISNLYRSYFMKPSDEFLFSQLLLNPWDFNIRKQKDAKNLCQATMNNIKAEINESGLKAVI